MAEEVIILSVFSSFFRLQNTPFSGTRLYLIMASGRLETTDFLVPNFTQNQTAFEL